MNEETKVQIENPEEHDMLKDLKVKNPGEGMDLELSEVISEATVVTNPLSGH
jgi:uncharacterized metal-binding protein YceD (DUF177 family)